MNDFNRCNKVTGVHWLKKPVESLHIKITVKPQDGILTLPKFEDYANETTSLSLQLDNQTKEFSFKWQEKVFSTWEIQRYSNIHNCINETELNYHEMIENHDVETSKLFTYIHEDYQMPLPDCGLKKVKSNENFLNLNSILERLSLNETVGQFFGHDTSSRSHLFRSQENVGEEEEQWTAMHVVFDNSDYNEDSQLLLKQECILVSLYHNKSHNYLLVSPNVTNLELNPYTVETTSGVQLGYLYSVDVNLESECCSEELVGLLKKMHMKWQRKHKQSANFIMPPIGTKQYYITLEILAADDFEMDGLYVEYHIKIPEELKCRDTLHGRSHVTKCMMKDDIRSAHFGHLIELSLETTSDAEPPPLQLFLELISVDWWGRHRTEGYSHLSLSLHPGRYHRVLSCSRPEELNSLEAMERRFFVGGCHLIQDLEVLAKLNMHANFATVLSGNIHVRWNTVSQSPTLALPTTQLHDRPSAAVLLRGAEAALKQYKKARARLAIATEGLNEATGHYEGSGDN